MSGVRPVLGGDVRVDKKPLCERCSATGSVTSSGGVVLRCEECGGRGYHDEAYETCEECKGIGRIQGRLVGSGGYEVLMCRACGGSGRR